ncbi:malonyl-CoA decarboxylase domain-containing protein [Roseateles sp. L2-2]|uniref:malonyl-CoA decarboxylase domain-containing protein n=1 Tax=Roseateles sp. L2-2 TaxID=3422597 RepID=UPI003D35A9BC
MAIVDSWTSARAARQVLSLAHKLLSERGQANSLGLAHDLIGRMGALPADAWPAVFDKLAADFNPEPAAVLRAAQAYADAPGTETLGQLTEVSEPPRQELFRRLNRAPGGTGTLVRMRRRLLEGLSSHPDWRMVDADLLHLLSSWFNPGFLEMRQVDWHSPAHLLEQIIHHEAVHAIDGWDDLRRRLLPDRRLFAFFHPQLPNEPLIFVEIALLPDMPDAIAPLIGKRSEAMPPNSFKTAVFYSISNCEPGLRGVSLGNFLIKRVAEHLRRELPRLKLFCTLSPIPGFARWLQALRTADDAAPGRAPPTPSALPSRLADLPGLKPAQRSRAAEALERLKHHSPTELASPAALDDEALQADLRRLAAVYLIGQTPLPGGDPVARFHLDNGARLERLNPGGDRSAKGLKQSHGMMVNYLYDLDRIEEHHEAFTQGEIATARAVGGLL